ncbi:MAG: DbpA RNA binding domain-containing protein, partial [Anaerolineae bacterium]|nr:DbpA RNA binding domain-containing protein [Anaerolineae bacterium]
HRVGRTGRAGRSGIAITLINPKERWRLRRIEGFTKQPITPGTIPTIEDIETHRETELLAEISKWLRRGRCRRERDMATTLVEDGYDPIEVAAVALKLARAEEKQRPIAPISEVEISRPKRTRQAGKNGKPKHRRAGRDRDRSNGAIESGMVRLSLNTGRINGLKVNHVVGTLAHYADIPGHVIGKIHIQEDRTFIDVPEQLVGQILTKTRNYKIGKQAVTIERT